MHLSYDDFCRLDIKEFAAIYNAYITQRDFSYKDEWERTRLIATILVQSHSEKTIRARDILPLPWDEEENVHERKTLTAEERQQRTIELQKRVNGYEQQHN